MKHRELKDKDNCSFWSSTKRHKGNLKINYTVKYFLQKWIISHPHVIKSSFENYYITVKFDDGIKVVKTELHHTVLL